MERLSAAAFADLIRHGPLVAIDLLVRRPDGRILLGWRENRPAQHWWFAPGGRVRKNERWAAAFRRVAVAEFGGPRELSEARMLGVYEHFYEDNALGLPDFGTHYVTTGYTLPVPADFEPAGDDQHSAVRWVTCEELRDDPSIHHHTRDYAEALMREG